MDTLPLVLTKDELWLCQSVVRHESKDQGDWKAPLTSLALNEQISLCLFLCEEFQQTEAALNLTYNECLLLDAVIPQHAKASNGEAIGKPLLKKLFRVRAEFNHSYKDIVRIASGRV